MRNKKFKLSERTIVEDGITHIRPWRNGKPGSTEKEIQTAFDDFRRNLDTMWKPDPKLQEMLNESAKQKR